MSWATKRSHKTTAPTSGKPGNLPMSRCQVWTKTKKLTNKKKEIYTANCLNLVQKPMARAISMAPTNKLRKAAKVGGKRGGIAFTKTDGIIK